MASVRSKMLEYRVTIIRGVVRAQGGGGGGGGEYGGGTMISWWMGALTACVCICVCSCVVAAF